MGWRDEKGNVLNTDSGKLIRPLLCLLSCNATGEDYEKVLPAAAAIQFIHDFSLIHDDIQDKSSFRRGRPTVWKLWGFEQAINSGDGIFALAFSALARLKNKGVNDLQITRALSTLTDSCLKLCEGQFMDISFDEKETIDIDSYLGMISKKTAALISAATTIGAYLGANDESFVNSMKKFGENLGMAYQISDDILGIWGIEDIAAKPILIDVINKKKTLPIVYALQNSTDNYKSILKRYYSKKGDPDITAEDIVEILNTMDIRKKSEEMEQIYHNKAMTELNSVQMTESAKELLVELVNFLIEREY
jgi:geranylgeranyl diphosphate synthase type I